VESLCRTGISKSSPAFPEGVKKEISSMRLIPKYFSREEIKRALPTSSIFSSFFLVKPSARTSALISASRLGATV
jgi:hypothetical protein